LSNIRSALKVGLLVVAVSWFVFTFTQFISGIQNVLSFTSRTPWFIVLSEQLGFAGLGFRSAASLIAIILVALYFSKRISKPKAFLAAKIVLLFEAAYYAITFIPSALFGVGTNPIPSFGMFVANFLPCIVEGVAIPVALVILVVKLGVNKPASGAIKWSLWAGISYILVFWVTNSCNWIYAIMIKNIEYVLEPFNLVSFMATVVGLALLTFYSAYFAMKSKATSWRELDFFKIGAIVSLVGLYFEGTYMTWVLAGSVGGWSAWYAWFLGHNVDLWVMTLPAVGLPLAFYISSAGQYKTPHS
jgi:hypothetical protein